MKNTLLKRIDRNTIGINNKFSIDAKLFANEKVPVENNAVRELANVLNIQETINLIKNEEPGYFDDNEAEISKVSVTPDFHKGSGIPIGTVLATKGFYVPQAIGFRH